jgi:quinol monooxygenase YgiN
MSPYVIIVEFKVKPGEIDRFMPLMLENAGRSLADEPGCRRFDVLTGEDGRVILYEIYDDEAAFDAHCRSAHYARFNSESEPLVTGKSVIRCDLVHEGLAAAGTYEPGARAGPAGG